MKHRIFVAVLMLLSFASSAQNLRLVRGVVFDASRKPIAGATIVADQFDETVTTGQDGTFQIKVPSYCKYVSATKAGLLKHTLEVDGSYLVFTLKVDKDYEKVQQQLAQQRQQAVLDSLAMVQQAEKLAREAEEKKRAAEEMGRKLLEEARQKVLADSLAAVKKAEELAEKQRLAEEAARKKAVLDSIARVQQAEKLAREAEEKKRAAEERGRKILEEERQRVLADSLAAVKKEEKRSIRQAAVAKYDSEYKNHGIVNSIDFSYGYQIAKGEVIYKNLGTRSYGDRMPLMATYSIGYRFGYLGAVSLGAGVLYDIRSTSVKGDEFISDYGEFKEHQVDVPVFLNLKFYAGKGKVQPVLSVSGGLYVLSVTPLADLGVGCSIRMSRSIALNILAAVNTTPWPYFDEAGKSCGYKMALTPGVKLGFNF